MNYYMKHLTRRRLCPGGLYFPLEVLTAAASLLPCAQRLSVPSEHPGWWVGCFLVWRSQALVVWVEHALFGDLGARRT